MICLFVWVALAQAPGAAPEATKQSVQPKPKQQPATKIVLRTQAESTTSFQAGESVPIGVYLHVPKTEDRFKTLRAIQVAIDSRGPDGKKVPLEAIRFDYDKPSPFVFRTPDLSRQRFVLIGLLPVDLTPQAERGPMLLGTYWFKPDAKTRGKLKFTVSESGTKLRAAGGEAIPFHGVGLAVKVEAPKPANETDPKTNEAPKPDTDATAQPAPQAPAKPDDSKDAPQPPK